jgi:chorismate--pyruvate lyase
MRDPYWQSLLLDSADYAPWLRDHGSLTRRIQQRCEIFAVQPLRSGLARVAYDEAALLGFSSDRQAFSREVFLVADGRPVVFAHSTCAREHLRGAWLAMRGLGNRSLGTLLFTHPLVIRQPLHYKALQSHHPLYKSAAKVLNHTPERLWARRSLFYLHDAPLLVTEVFLPEILALRNGDSTASCYTLKSAP